MSLPLHITALVLLAAVLHAIWNAVVKTGEDRVLTMALVIGVGSLIALPVLPFTAIPAPVSWLYLLLSLLLHVGYFIFLLQAYKFGDLSYVYPVARGAAPLLVAAGGAVFAGERLAPGAFAGLLLASLAIASFAFERGVATLRRPRPFVLALVTAAFISSYTVTDALGVRASGSPLGFIAWLFLLSGCPLVGYALVARPGALGPYARAHWKLVLIGGTICALAYALVILALTFGAMARVSALRETSVVFAVLIGWIMLGEPFGGRRIVATVLVAAGIAVMSLSGGGAG